MAVMASPAAAASARTPSVGGKTPGLKTPMLVTPSSTTVGLPSLLNHRRAGIKAAQTHMAPLLGRWTKRMPTILEVEEGEGTAKAPVSTLPACIRPASLPESIRDSLSLATDASHADAAVACLKDGNRIERSQLFTWLLQSASGAVLTLALSEHGSRVMLAALEVAVGPDRNTLVSELEGHIVELAKSQHGHEVLMRLIEVMPLASTGFVIKELADCCTSVAQDRYGCHVLNLLIMHCSEKHLADLTDQVLQETEMLSKHRHGSSVLQHLLEYGTSACRQSILHHVLPHVHLLAMDKTASQVLQQVIEHCEGNGKFTLANALLRNSSWVSMTDLACSRRGSAILRDLAGAGVCVDEIRVRLAHGLARLSKSKYGRRVIIAFGLPSLPSADANKFAPCEAAALPQGQVMAASSKDAWRTAAMAA